MEQPNFESHVEIGSDSLRRVRSENDIHRHPGFAYKENGQPIYDFAIIRVNRPFWGERKSFNNRIIPICLPTISMWHKSFFDWTVQISGYGRIEKDNIKGEYPF